MRFEISWLHFQLISMISKLQRNQLIVWEILCVFKSMIVYRVMYISYITIKLSRSICSVQRNSTRIVVLNKWNYKREGELNVNVIHRLEILPRTKIHYWNIEVIDKILYHTSTISEPFLVDTIYRSNREQIPPN